MFIKEQNINIKEKLFGKIDVDYSLYGTQFTSVLGLEYVKSSFTVTSSTFDQCYAFGRKVSGPCGGAIFLSRSICVIKETDFTKNIAADGGAVCLIRSNAFLDGKNDHSSKFESNTAYSSGGAILFEGYTPKDENSKSFTNNFQLFIYKYTFTSNKADQTGGAISIDRDSEIYLENLILRYNTAGDQGGAIFCLNAKLSVFKSAIQANAAGENNRTVISKNQSRSDTNKYSLRFRGRGCGGIAFISIDDQRHFISQENCFSYNKMFNGFINTLESSSKYTDERGNDYMLEGNAYWQSYKDYLQDSEKAYAFIGNTSQFIKQIYQPLSYDTQPNDDKCKQNSVSESKFSNVQTLSLSNARKSNEGNDEITSQVPPPSPFVYAATPITRLPQKTTSSHTFYSSFNSSRWTISFTYSVAATFFRTPFSTPHMTPYYTPDTTFEPTAMTPCPSSNPLNEETKTTIYTLSDPRTAYLTLTALVTNITSTITTIFTNTLTLSMPYTENTYKLTNITSITTIATNLASNETYTLYYPTFTNTATYTDFYNNQKVNSTINYLSFTNSASSVLSATFVETNRSLIEIPSNFGIFPIMAYTNSSTTTVTYTINNEDSLVLTKTDYAIILTAINAYASGIFSLTNGQSTTLTSTFINCTTSTFTIVQIPTVIPTIQHFSSTDFSTFAITTSKLTLVPNITVTTLSGISYISGYTKASENTITVVYYPYVTLYSTITTLDDSQTTYTYTAVTTLTQTYSSINQNSEFVSYYSLQTTWTTNTLTFSYSMTNTITGTNVFTLTQTESSYFSINPTGISYTVISSTLKANIQDLPTNVTFNSPVFTWTFTFYLPINGISDSVFYTFTQVILGSETVSTVLHVPELSFDGVLTSYINTNTLVGSTTNIDTLTYTISYFSDSSTPSSLSIEIPTFITLFTTKTNISIYTFDETNIITQTITNYYSTAFTEVVYTAIYSTTSIYKSTYHNNNLTLMETETIAKILTSLTTNINISTVIEYTFSGTTQYMTQLETFTIANDITLTTTYYNKTSTATMINGPSINYEWTAVNKLSTVFVYPLLTKTLLSTATVIDYPIYTIENQNVTITHTTTATYILTNTMTIFNTTTYLIDAKEISYINTSIIEGKLIPTYTETDVLTYNVSLNNAKRLMEIDNKQFSGVKFTIPATSNPLLAERETLLPNYTYTETTVHSPVPNNLILKASTIYIYSSTTTIFSSTYINYSDTVIYTFTEIPTYTDAFISFNPSSYANQGGTSYVTSYSFKDVTMNTSTIVFTSMKTMLEVNLLSYTKTNSILTVTSGSGQTSTISWYGSQVTKDNEYITYSFTDITTNFVTMKNDNFTIGLILTTYMLMTNIKAITDSFVLVPKIVSTNVSYTYVNISGETVVPIIISDNNIPPRTPAITPMLTPTPKPKIGDMWGSTSTTTAVKKVTSVTDYKSSYTVVLPGQSTKISTITIVNSSTFTNVSQQQTDTYTKTEVQSLTEFEVVNTGRQLIVATGATMGYKDVNTRTYESTLTISIIKTADTYLIIKDTDVPAPIVTDTNISSITFEWKSVTNANTSIPTYTSVPTSIYTVITLPNEDETTTTYTNTFTQSITNISTQLTEGNTLLPVNILTTANTLTETKKLENTVVLSLKPTHFPSPSNWPSPTPRPPIPLRTPEPTMTPKRPNTDPGTDTRLEITKSLTDTETVASTKSKTLIKALFDLSVNSSIIQIPYLTETDTDVPTYTSTQTYIDVLTYKSDVSVTQSKTIIATSTLSNTTISKETLSVTNTTTTHESTNKNTTTFTISLTYIVTQTYVSTNVETMLLIAQEGVTKSKMSSGTLILVCSLVIGSSSILGILGVTLYRKSRKTSSSGFEDEESTSLNDTNLFGSVRIENTIIKFDEDDENQMITTFAPDFDDDDGELGTIQDANDDDDIFMNKEF